MPHELKGTGDKGVLVLAGDYGIENAGELKACLTEAMEKFGDFDLDLSRVESVDLTFLQSIRAAQVSQEAKGKSITCESAVAPGVVEFAERAGFSLQGAGHCFWRRDK